MPNKQNMGEKKVLEDHIYLKYQEKKQVSVNGSQKREKLIYLTTLKVKVCCRTTKYMKSRDKLGKIFAKKYDKKLTPLICKGAIQINKKQPTTE